MLFLASIWLAAAWLDAEQAEKKGEAEEEAEMAALEANELRKSPGEKKPVAAKKLLPLPFPGLLGLLLEQSNAITVFSAIWH